MREQSRDHRHLPGTPLGPVGEAGAQQRERHVPSSPRPAAAPRRTSRPSRSAALHTRPDAGSTTAPAKRPSVAHRGHGHRVPGQPVEEVDGAVDRVDHPVHARTDRAAAVLLPQHRVAGPQRGEPLAHQRLDGVVGGRDDVGGGALGAHPDAVRPVSAVPRAGQIAQVRQRLRWRRVRRSGAARGGRRRPWCPRWTLPGRCCSLTVSSDHMTALHDAREADREYVPDRAVTMSGYPQREGLRHKPSDALGGATDLDRQPESGVSRPVSGKRTVARGPSGSRRSRKPQRHHRRPAGARPGAPPFAGGCGGEDRHQGRAEGAGLPTRQEGCDSREGRGSTSPSTSTARRSSTPPLKRSSSTTPI